MKKAGVFIFIVLISPIIGGFYGILHDQLTFTISPEYYTKFKFLQFGVVDEYTTVYAWNIRCYVSIVGFFATWWFGLIIGVILGAIGFIHRNSKTMMGTTLKAILLTISITLIAGLAGLVYGYLFLINKPHEYFFGWYIPENLVDFESFILVGSMHNFSYAGGILGLIAGIIYSIRQNRKVLNQSLSIP